MRRPPPRRENSRRAPGRDGREDRGNFLIKGANRGQRGPELGGVRLDDEGQRVHDGGVGGQRLGGGHLFQPCVDDGGAAAVVLLIEAADGGGPRALDGGEGGPLLEEVAGLAGVEAPDPGKGLGEVLLEHAG